MRVGFRPQSSLPLLCCGEDKRGGAAVVINVLLESDSDVEVLSAESSNGSEFKDEKSARRLTGS